MNIFNKLWYCMLGVNGLVNMLEKLASDAQWSSGKKQKRCALKYGKIFSGIDDMDLLNAIYEKQPYKEEVVKQTAAKRFYQLIDQVEEVSEILEISNRKYTHVFNIAAIDRAVELVANLDDKKQLENIKKGNYHWSIVKKAKAKFLKLSGNNTKLLRIIYGMDDEYGYAMDDAINALQYLDDLKELEKIALNGMIVHGQNYKDVQLTAMEKLVSLTTDITVLKKIKKVADGNSHFFYFKGTIDDRINQLSKQ